MKDRVVLSCETGQWLNSHSHGATRLGFWIMAERFWNLHKLVRLHFAMGTWTGTIFKQWFKESCVLRRLLAYCLHDGILYPPYGFRISSKTHRLGMFAFKMFCLWRVFNSMFLHLFCCFRKFSSWQAQKNLEDVKMSRMLGVMPCWRRQDLKAQS